MFFSYSTKDRWVAEQIVRHIEERCEEQVSVFMDQRGIGGGESIPDVVKQKIQECDEFVVFLTQNSIRRQWVNIELGVAWGEDKRIIAITHNVSPKAMQDIIVSKKAFDLNESFDEYCEELAGRVEERVRG